MSHSIEKFSYLKVTNSDYIDEMLEKYNLDPQSVDESWRFFFEGLEIGGSDTAFAPAPSDSAEADANTLEFRAKNLIRAYRTFGKWFADTNPLETPQVPAHFSKLLDPATYLITATDLEKTVSCGSDLGLPPSSTVKQIIDRLKLVYCGKIAFEYSQVQIPEEIEWLKKQIEQGGFSNPQFSIDPETQKFILKRISESETFERFLHTRYVAQKRFSVEGGESSIPCLDCMIESGAELGAQEFVVGMAHRGRLNTLTHVFGKKPEYIFTEFEGTYKTDLSLGEGDVKYHMGYSADMNTRKGHAVHLSLANNPSHLEFVNPVVEGIARSKQADRKDFAREKVIPVQIHGDAAFAGQGVCFETLGMSQLKGYTTGGTVHLIINNQVGFTTSPKDSRSTPYSTDLAKVLDAPVFHVNGDAPLAVWAVTRLAMAYRQKFKKDVFIDLVCYRKHGHNEGDEPSFTQPLMYKKIKSHPSTREILAQDLETRSVLPAGTGQKWVDEITQKLMDAQAITKKDAPHPEVSVFEGNWKGMKRPQLVDFDAPVSTHVNEKTLRSIGEKLNQLPADFHLHPKLQRFFEGRAQAIQKGQGIDWGNGETLAFATLIAEGHPVRITGQDAERGTFTHRHSVVTDFETGKTLCPLNQLSSEGAFYEVHNSHLSETAVLGFEYGFSLSNPRALTIWEAQFGDFSNGAQVIIDQFIATGESKWQRMSGLVLLLPHGYEGQGPEHSSARLERFLQLCGKNNMSVCHLTTPAQIFHALRRQVKRSFRKPLIVMSPKSLLRHPQAISELKEFSEGQFHEVLDDATVGASQKSGVKTVLLCTGKVYYDLLAEKTRLARTDVALVRVEQLYPWPAQQLKAVLSLYPKAQLRWVQEEPRNMGAWSYIFNTFAGGLSDFSQEVGQRPIRYVGRDIGASPAVGSPKVHEKELKAFLEKAFQSETGEK